MDNRPLICRSLAPIESERHITPPPAAKASRSQPGASDNVFSAVSEYDFPYEGLSLYSFNARREENSGIYISRLKIESSSRNYSNETIYRLRCIIDNRRWQIEYRMNDRMAELHRDSAEIERHIKRELIMQLAEEIGNNLTIQGERR